MTATANCWSSVTPNPEVPPTGQSLHVVCSLTVLGQCHTDVGEGRDPKAAFSDALKRAAVPFGIGRSIYAVPRRFLYAEDSKRPPRDKLRRKGERLYLTASNEALLREEYEQWLAEVGIAAFGEPLDHGPDDAGAEDEGGRGSEVGADASPVGGGLRAVSSGEPSDPPATIHERRTLSAEVANGAYQEETVKQLAGLVFGERLLDRLSRSQMVELERMLERASAAAVTDAALAERLRRADQQRDSAAVEAIGAWLREPAPDAVGEGERRAA